MNQQLIYIIRVETAPARFGGGIVPIDSHRCLSDAYIPFQPIPINGCAQLTTETETEGCLLYKTEVRLSMLCTFPHWDEPQIFRLTDLSGNSFIVGTGSAPFVRVDYRTERPARPTDRATAEIQLHWAGIYAPLEIMNINENK